MTLEGYLQELADSAVHELRERLEAALSIQGAFQESQEPVGDVSLSLLHFAAILQLASLLDMRDCPTVMSHPEAVQVAVEDVYCEIYEEVDQDERMYLASLLRAEGERRRLTLKQLAASYSRRS